MNRMLAFKAARSLAKRSPVFGNLFKRQTITSISARRHKQTTPIVAVNLIHRYYHDDFHDTEEEPLYEYVFKEPPIPIKNVLYPVSGDPLIEQLKTLASLQNVFDFIQKYRMILEHRHLAQIVLVVWDLQKMFYHVNVISNVANVNGLMRDYIEQLLGRDEFSQLLVLIEEKLEGFNTEELSCVLLYLHKIGVPLRNDVMQELTAVTRGRLEGEEVLPLRAAARFVVSVFGKSPTTSYFICQDIMPKIFNYIDDCKTAEDVRLLTICLNYLNKIIQTDNLEKYKGKVRDLIKSGVINKDEYSTILKIILFLNFPHWRDRNVDSMADCMALLKDNIHLMNVYELLILSNIFHRTLQPASILNNIQRHACKFLYELEEEMSPYLDIRLKLLSCIICFSPPSQRPHFEKIIRRYLSHKMSGENLLDLYTVFHYMNNSDVALCRTYWDKVLEVMESDQQFRENNLLRIAQNYLNFTRTPNVRNARFEKRLNQWLEGELEQGVSNIVPSRFAVIGSFFLAYNHDVSLVNHVAIKLDSIWEQLNVMDCHHLSRSLQMGKTLNNPALKPRYQDSVTNTLHRCFERESSGDTSVYNNILMLRTASVGNNVDDVVVQKLLDKLTGNIPMSSRTIKNLCFCLLSLNTLVPHIIDSMVDYICARDGDILAFNVENVAFLCYYLGYTPKNHVKFFEILKNVLLRDQERLSGLSYVQSCLSLCYFNMMTDAFTKQIFNNSFLEKIDAELLSCYSRDVYPMRVRNRLMELNRSICIDYPESNIPWFHQKYVENTNHRERLNFKHMLTDNVQEYLAKMFDTIRIRKNVTTHYGYQIDYVINFCQDVAEESKIALLVLGPNAFTKVNVQLRGYYQQKIRHLEMFGYRVAVLKFTDWKDLICGEDRITYLNSIVSQKLGDVRLCEINR